MKLVNVENPVTVCIELVIKEGIQFLPDRIASSVVGLNNGKVVDYSKMTKQQLLDLLEGA